MSRDDFTAPDLGNPLQNMPTPDAPIPYVLTKHDRDVATVASLELERQRRERNRRDAMRRKPEPPEAA
jgi:hypothetical protein